MGIGIKEYMEREEFDPTLPPEFHLPCASDSPKERQHRAAARRLEREEGEE